MIPRGHVLAQVLYVASAMILVKFSTDVLLGAFPHNVAVRQLKAAV